MDLTSAVAVNGSVIFFFKRTMCFSIAATSLYHCHSGVSVHTKLLVVSSSSWDWALPSNFEICFCIHWSTNRTGAYQKLGENLSEFILFIRNTSEKNNPACSSVFPLLLTSLLNFKFFFAFIKLEILTRCNKKKKGIFVQLFEAVTVYRQT